ncbi:MAG: insulinase family protein [Phycisphaeraceae bacterium]|nr:insulinase family protein [Phycisphaeraceae bacterium]MCW5762987.1 insulinase family protein [Phycisphaeraceae bacterium]
MPITFQQHQLANGLRIIAEVDPDAHSSAVGFFVNTGARDEAPAIMGVSHFLEHMMFKGSDDLSADDINRLFDEIGARNNAYTSNELTCFHAQVLPEYLPNATQLLARMLRPALRTEDFDLEKNVILEEIAMYKDNPFWVLYEACVAKHYADHPLGHRVLGTTESVSALSRDQMMQYFAQRYSADNTVLSLAGRVDFDATVKMIEDLCGSWVRTGATRNDARPQTHSDSLTMRDERVNRAYVISIMPAPAVQDDRRYAASLLMQVLGGSDNSRLHWALIETGIAEEAQSAYDAHQGTGDYFVYASGDPDRLDEIEAIIDQQLLSLVDSLTPADLEKMRMKIATSATLSGERPNDRMQRIGRQWLAHGRHRSLEEELERIESVTIDDLREVASLYPFTQRTTGRLIPA